MKKADLIDAILGAGNNESGDAGSDGSNEKPKRVRSRRASEADDPMAELAAVSDWLTAPPRKAGRCCGPAGGFTTTPASALRPMS